MTIVDLRARQLLLNGTLPAISGAFTVGLPVFLRFWSFFAEVLVGLTDPVDFLPLVFGFEPGRNMTVRLSSALSAGVP